MGEIASTTVANTSGDIGKARRPAPPPCGVRPRWICSPSANQVSIAGKPLQQSVELPATALRGDNTVLLVSDDSRLERLPVELLRRERDRVWVRGIEAGQGVVAEQSSLLAAGAAIEVASVRASSG